MNRIARFLVPLGLAGAVSASALHAQDAPIDEAAVRARLAREMICIEGAKTDLTQWTRLLADARRQLESGSSPEVRQDAAHSIVVLEAHVRETGEAILACVEPPAEPARANPAPSVAAPAALTALSVHLRATAPVSSGRGQLDASAVHRALLPYGRDVDVCYEALADRHAIVRGTAELVLRVRPDGAVAHTELRGLAIGDATFARCVDQARARIGSPGRPTGGEATLSVTLHFGPEG